METSRVANGALPVITPFNSLSYACKSVIHWQLIPVCCAKSDIPVVVFIIGCVFMPTSSDEPMDVPMPVSYSSFLPRQRLHVRLTQLWLETLTALEKGIRVPPISDLRLDSKLVLVPRFHTAYLPIESSTSVWFGAYGHISTPPFDVSHYIPGPVTWIRSQVQEDLVPEDFVIDH